MRVLMYLCVGEKKINSFEIIVIIFKAKKKNVNLQFKKDFKKCTKFSFTLKIVFEIAKQTKETSKV